MKAQNDRKVRAVLDIVEKEGEGKMIHLIMDSINYMEEEAGSAFADRRSGRGRLYV